MSKTYELVDAPALPRVSAPKRVFHTCGMILMVTFAIVAVLFIVIVATNIKSGPAAPPVATLTPAQIKNGAVTVPFDTLARETEKYIGTNLHVRAEVIEVRELSGSNAIVRANMTKGDYNYSDTIWINYTGPRILVGDIIDMYARVDGRRSYKAVLGQQITLPEMTALVVEVVKE